MGRTKRNEPSPLKQKLGVERPASARTQSVKRKPKCPTFLSEEGKKVWKEVVGILDEAGLLDRADQHLLEVYCVAVSEFRAIYKIVARDGHADYTGAMSRISPESQTLRALADQQIKLAKELGLTPAARNKIGIEPIDPAKKPKKDGSTLSDLVNKMKVKNG